MTGDAMREVIELLAMEQCSYRRVERCAHSCGSCSYKAAQQVAAITAAPASARLALARAITPDTHAVVPVEATIEMRWAGNEFHATADIYRAMVKRGAEGGK